MICFYGGQCCDFIIDLNVHMQLYLQVHGEVTDPNVDVFDREKVFIDTVLQPLIQRLPQLKVVMEHITTMDAVRFVESCNDGMLNHFYGIFLSFTFLAII